MAGATFYPGEQKIRPGVFVRVTKDGQSPEGDIPQGIVAAVFRSSWGPLNKVVSAADKDEVAAYYGDAETVSTAIEAFNGGCREVVCLRLGTGGEKATGTLKSTSAEDVLRINAKFPGKREFSVTIRDSLADVGKREFILYEGTTQRQITIFDKGANEIDSLAESLTVSNSPWIEVVKLEGVSGTLENIVQAPISGGEDPVITGEDYAEALKTIEPQDWNVLCVDSEDPAVHATIQAYINRVRSEGKRVMGTVGEPISVPYNTRLTHARSFNDYAICYCANGFEDAAGNQLVGYKAAARLAGMVAASPSNSSLTAKVVKGAINPVEMLSPAQIKEAIKSGAIVFTFNSRKQVKVEYGITTFTVPDKDHDEGWKKIRRVKTRDELMTRIAAEWERLYENDIDNDDDGHATLIAAAKGIIDKMISPERKLISGTVDIDTSSPPIGDSAWFKIGVVDKDSAEKLYITFGFRFGANGGVMAS